MKNAFLWLVLLTCVPSSLFAAMNDYCSAPPYVTRTVAPNIMVLMDNSEDMMGPAYPDSTYLPSATNDNYKGYFDPQACYQYSNKFSVGTQNADGSCPSTAPFRGNLLNWATTSKYDLLQKVLIGGNTVSKQGNSHTVLAIGGTFPERSFPAEPSANKCIFQYNNGNLSITEETPGACGLLNPNPGFALNLNPFRIFGEMFARGTELLYQSIFSEMVETSRALLAHIGDFALVGKAWAAQATGLSIDVVSGAFDIPLGQTYSLTLEGSGGDSNDTYIWSTGVMDPAPSWLAKGSAGNASGCISTGNKTCVRQVYSGIPMVAGSYTFTVALSDSDGRTPTTRTFTINVQPEPLRIITDALSPAQRDTYYEFTMTAMGGVQFYNDAAHPDADADGDPPPHYHWSATGLPTNFFIDQATGKISGVPNTVGTYTVNITATGAAGQSVTRAFSLQIANLSLHLLTDNLSPATKGTNYITWLECGGGLANYTWSATGLTGTGLSLSAYTPTNTAYIIGTPTVSGVFDVTVTVRDSTAPTSQQATKTFSLVIGTAGASLTINNGSVLPPAYAGFQYWAQASVSGGVPPYSYAWAGTPPGTDALYLHDSWFHWASPTVSSGQSQTFTFTLTVTDSAAIPQVVSKTFSLQVYKNASVRKVDFRVKIDLPEEDFIDANGNGIWDLGETFDVANDDLNGNGKWDGKKGIFQTFWDANDPKARWGLTMYRDQAASTLTSVSACIPASPASSYFTNIQNATATQTSPLADALYGAINYYGFDAPYGAGFTGCTNSDPIDTVPCRKNFILVISSGSDVSGTAFSTTSHPTDFPAECIYTDPAVQNACYAYNKDLRADSVGKQNVYTYVVNTMGTANNGILEEIADAGGGAYYDATNASDLESKLTNALQDILSQAASGTAVSVLTTSSRGIGSMMQAYFLPVRLEGERELNWTGYAQNIWIDPKDNLREDTQPNDFQLKLDTDNIIKLYFDTATNETKAAVFTSDSIETCIPEEIRDFDKINYTWEGGTKLALQAPSSRTLFTATNVVHGDGTSNSPTFSPSAGEDFPLFETGMEAALVSALGADATDTEAPYTAENIIRYVRGECLETGVNGDAACGGTSNNVYRDRRATVAGGSANGNVWKLGDIISSTPKVLANTPVNTYHLDYGDSTYYGYISGTSYKQRSAMAFVGANDGVLHAFRVGYLKDTGLADGVKALVKNFFGSTDSNNDLIGKEVWGYIPYNTFPYLKYLASPDYCHMYFNDLSVRLVDASLGCNGDNTCDDAGDTRATASWRTILIGGMRFGGGCNGGAPAPPAAGVGYSAFYAIDVTDAENPVPLWEFSDPDLGYTTSFPSIIRTGAKDKNGSWYVVVGSGSTTMPKNNVDIARSTTGYIYFLDLKTGALVRKVALDHNAIVGDILSIDGNKDYGTEKLYFGTAYNASGTWKGKIARMNLPADTSITSDPPITYLFDDVYPITASLDVAKDAEGKIWVYAGSGKYFSDVDEVDSSNQIILGMTDLDAPSPAYPWTSANLADQTNAVTSGTVSGTQQVCGFDGSDFTLQDVVTSISNPTITNANTVTNGWFVTLNGGERVITRPLAVGGLVDFLTYAPSSDVCSYGGNSYLYAFGYTSGLAPTNIAIRSAATTDGTTSGTVNVARGVLLGPGAPPTGEAIIIPPPKEGQEQLKKKIQIATGVIVEAENTPVLSVISKIVHWLKK